MERKKDQKYQDESHKSDIENERYRQRKKKKFNGVEKEVEKEIEKKVEKEVEKELDQRDKATLTHLVSSQNLSLILVDLILHQDW